MEHEQGSRKLAGTLPKELVEGGGSVEGSGNAPDDGVSTA